MSYSFDISNFLEEIFSLSRQFYCFPLFLCMVHWKRPSYLSLLFSGILHSIRYIYHFLSPVLFTSLLPSAITKASSDNHFAFSNFFFFVVVLVTASCTMLWASIHSSSDTLSPDLTPWIHTSPPLHNDKGLDLGHTWMIYWSSPLSLV